MKEKQRILNFILLGISLLIITEFLIGILNWQAHWWVLVAWFSPFIGGIPYFVKEPRQPKLPIATIVVFFLFGISSTSAQYEWQLLSSSPQNGQKQDDVYFINPEMGWSVNGSGRIYQTTDGGASWNLQYSSSGTYFRCIGFVDSQVGFAGNIGPNYFPGVTDNNILYKTIDGGDSWEVVGSNHISGPLPTGLCAIQVIDDLNIVAGGRVGGPARWMKSTDGGETWTSNVAPSGITMITDIFFENPETGYLFGGSNANIQLSKAVVMKTLDGGDTWEKVFESSRTFELCWKASFPNPQMGYATLLNYAPNYPQRYIAKTQDGGTSWEEIQFATNSQRAFGIGFINESTGWIGTDQGGFQTTDGGQTWQSKNIGNFVNKIRMVTTPNEGVIGYAIGQRIYKMTDVLPTSTKERFPQDNHLNLRIFPNPVQHNASLSFELEKQQVIKISAYDQGGTLVNHILSGKLAPGAHQIDFNLKDRTPSILNIVIELEDGVITRRLVIAP